MFVFRVFSIVLLVCFMLQCVFAVPMYKKVGGSVVLDSGHKSGPLTSVTWKHQADLALEWFGSEITCYRTFQGRCNLDKTTGSFTITNLILEDSGKYTPEINSVVGGTMELKVIKPVPKPTVSMAWNTEETVCKLTCEANISSEFGPITYKWKTGDTELSNEKELSLTTKNEEPSFFCVLGNPVSNSASDEFSNPISKESNVAAVAVPVVLGILLIAVVVVAFVMYKKVPRVRTMWPFKYVSKKNKSKDKVELNGYQPVNVNEDGINNINHTVVSIEQQQPDPPTEQVSDNQAEPGQISTSEETKPTAEEPGKSKDSTCDPPADTEPEQGSSEESNLDPSAGSPEPSSQTENKSEGKEELNGEAKVNEDVSTEQQQQQQQQLQQGSHTEQVSNNQAGPGQISTSEETKPTAEGPGKSKDSTCDPPDTEPEQGSSQESNLDPSAGSPEPSSQTENKSEGKEELNGEAKVNEDVSTEQQQQQQQQQLLDPPTEQVSNNEAEPGQSSESDETKPTAEGPEIVSPPNPRRAVTPGTDSAES
ncbi:SUN domain-containing protein 2-like isoform X2 [Xiphophorus hellerii]|uniref:SUN domain-containing protein 2-like isoform X2 n=1 Tax=Xiphophorus hellerii TaxID=8084 RepID=UPI0013B40B83|nr:SUN domain-containing protein 2-like isoform X2 [Xiphophorus hellerii]